MKKREPHVVIVRIPPDALDALKTGAVFLGSAVAAILLFVLITACVAEPVGIASRWTRDLPPMAVVRRFGQRRPGRTRDHRHGLVIADGDEGTTVRLGILASPQNG